jgi:Ca2+/Na+ antiporter
VLYGVVLLYGVVVVVWWMTKLQHFWFSSEIKQHETLPNQRAQETLFSVVVVGVALVVVEFAPIITTIIAAIRAMNDFVDPHSGAQIASYAELRFRAQHLISRYSASILATSTPANTPTTTHRSESDSKV